MALSRPVRAADHDPDDGAPRQLTSGDERSRFAVLTAGTMAVAGGVVIAVSQLLPVLQAWVLPALLSVLTVGFLAVGRRAAWGGRTLAARAWAGWAGVTVALAAFGLVGLAGFGGALVGTLVLVVVAEAAIALWFRSPVHFAVAQVLALVWAVIAHVFGILPVGGLVAGLAGLWWVGVVGVSRSVVVATTIVLPVSAALLVHPSTHAGAAVDAADVAVLVGAVAVAVVLTSGLVRHRLPTTTLWSTARATVLVVLVVQVLLGAVPAVAEALAPERPWPSLLLGIAAVLASTALAVLRPVRAGTGTVLVLCGAVLAEVLAAVTVGTALATTVGLAVLAGVALLSVVRIRPTGPRAVAVWGALLVLPAAWAALVGLPTPVLAAVLLVSGLAVVVAQLGRTRTAAGR